MVLLVLEPQQLIWWIGWFIQWVSNLLKSVLILPLQYQPAWVIRAYWLNDSNISSTFLC